MRCVTKQAGCAAPVFQQNKGKGESVSLQKFRTMSMPQHKTQNKSGFCPYYLKIMNFFIIFYVYSALIYKISESMAR